MPSVDTVPVPQPANGPPDFTWLQDFLSSIQSHPLGQSLILRTRNVTALYHYTDLGGFKGIIDSGDLWLTHLQFSNDNEELTYGRDLVRETLAQRIAAAPGDLYLTRLRERLEQPGTDNVYICCFCEENNLLSQWRGYGANGAGVCVRFDIQRFDHLTGPDCPGGMLRLWKVFYEPGQQRGIIESAIDYFRDPAGGVELQAQRAAEAIQFFIPTFKNPDFLEEAEWRLIFTPNAALATNPAFRTGRGLLIPYYGLQSLGWGDQPLPITGVCVGPGTHKTINAQSIQMLLAQRRYNGIAAYPGVTVEVSRTPYRG